MKLSMSEWNLLMIYIKDKCGIKEKHKMNYGKRISKLAKDLEKRKINETGMTKSLDMYPKIIFFEDLLNEVTKLENKIDTNNTDSNKLDPYEIKNYVKVALFNQDAFAFDYFRNEQTKKVLKDFMCFCRPFWHSKQLYEEYYYNKLMYYKLLENKRYSLKVIMLRKNFEMRLKITKKLVKQFAYTDCNSQTLTMSLMDEIL